MTSSSDATAIDDTSPPTWRERTRYAIWRTIANWLPRTLCYCAAARLGAHANCGKWADEDPREMMFFDVLRRWYQPNLRV